MRILPFFILMSLFLNQHLLAQQTYFINESDVLNSRPQLMKSIKQSDSIRKSIEADILEKQKKMNSKVQQLLAPYSFNSESTTEEIKSKLSANDREKYSILLEEYKLLEKHIELKKQEFELFYREQVESQLKLIKDQIGLYCKKNNIILLLKIDVLQNALLYYDKKYDITETIIKLLK